MLRKTLTFVIAAIFVMTMWARPIFAAPASPPTPAGMIDLGPQPLDVTEINSLMAWIAAQTGALRLPFCWKQSYGNGAGEPYACKAGFERNGLLCYPKCRAGFVGNGPVCWETCPAGFRDDGAFCGKPAAYTRGAGYVAWEGDQCKKDHPEGCEENGLLWYPKCKPNFHAVGCCVCSPDCPAGTTDIGVSCQKQSYGRGAGEPLAMGDCGPGLQKDPSGALCYPTCKTNFKMVGPVCWQNCPNQLSWDCGAACSTDQSQCAKAVSNMVVSPIMLAISLIPYVGEVKGVAQGAETAAKVAETAEEAAKGGEALSGAAKFGEGAGGLSKGATATARLKAAYQSVKGAVAGLKGNITEAVGGAENLAKLTDGARFAGKVYVASNAVTKEIDLFSKEFADNFAALTSPAIAARIDRAFGKEGAYQVKRQWGIRHLILMLNADGFATVKDNISLASAADPTGILSVVSAYDNPICGNDAPFPTLHPLYTN